MSAGSTKVMPTGFKWWMIGCTCVLVFSLVLLVGNVVAAFAYFSAKTSPLWVTVLGVVAVLGVAAGFGGLFLLLVMVAVRAWREERRRVADEG